MRVKLFNIDISCTFPAVALMTLVILLDTRHTAELCILAAIIHEGGHLLAMLFCKRMPDKIKISLFSIDINDPNRGKGRFFEELLIIYAGIAANGLASLAAFSVYRAVGDTIFLNIAAANAVIGAFNLLPAATLDGGQGLFLIIMRRLNYRSAEIIINILTAVLLIPFTAAGILLLFNCEKNFSLLIISVYLILALAFRKEYF